MKSPTLTVAQALARVLDGVVPLEAETIDLTAAAGRTLAEPVRALLTQPPFDASAMDGYAIRASDLDGPAELEVIGEAAAGRRFHGMVGTGQAVRIFTGAPVPPGADAIAIQEDCERRGARVLVRALEGPAAHVRRRGFDFAAGDILLAAGRRLAAREVTLAAAAGHPALSVRRRPVVALLANGDELVTPGTTPGPDQIVCSNTYGIAAMAAAAGAAPRLLGIARDTRESLSQHIAAARDADVLVTVGGASVGEHDLVRDALASQGLALDFWRIAMRPGKPLMFGRLGPLRVLGMPGNPVSALICARLFLVPLVRRLLGDNSADLAPRQVAAAVPLEANGPREHYMRARLERDGSGRLSARPVRSQDSSLLSPLAEADGLIVRPIDAPAVPAGASVPLLPLDF